MYRRSGKINTFCNSRNVNTHTLMFTYTYRQGRHTTHIHAHIINALKIASIFDVGLAHVNNGHTKSLHMHTAIEDTTYTCTDTHAQTI